LDSGGPHQEELSVRDLLSAHKSLVILGEPGAGKTTFVRRIAYSICSHDARKVPEIDRRLFPILVECRDGDIRSAFSTFDKNVRKHDLKVTKLQAQHTPSSARELKRLRYPPDPLISFSALRLKRMDFPFAELFVETLFKDGRVVLFVDGLLRFA